MCRMHMAQNDSLGVGQASDAIGEFLGDVRDHPELCAAEIIQRRLDRDGNVFAVALAPRAPADPGDKIRIGLGSVARMARPASWNRFLESLQVQGDGDWQRLADAEDFIAEEIPPLFSDEVFETR